jgi:uncharacterized protein (TIGR00251 family)
MAADIRVKVVPRSSRNQLAGREENVYRIKVTSPPVEGKANKALIAFLAEKLDIPKRKIELLSGQRSRTKTIRIHHLTAEQVRKRLED